MFSWLAGGGFGSLIAPRGHNFGHSWAQAFRVIIVAGSEPDIWIRGEANLPFATAQGFALPGLILPPHVTPPPSTRSVLCLDQPEIRKRTHKGILKMSMEIGILISSSTPPPRLPAFSAERPRLPLLERPLPAKRSPGLMPFRRWGVNRRPRRRTSPQSRGHGCAPVTFG